MSEDRSTDAESNAGRSGGFSAGPDRWFRGASRPEIVLLALLCLLIVSLNFSGVDWSLRAKLQGGFLKYHNIIIVGACLAATVTLLRRRSAWGSTPLAIMLASYLLAAWGGWYEAGDKAAYVDLLPRIPRGYMVIFCLAVMPAAKRSLWIIIGRVDHAYRACRPLSAAGAVGGGRLTEVCVL